MFLLISFVFAKNYCVEKKSGQCKSICQSFSNEYDDIFDHIPTNEEINTENNEIHDIYISDVVEYVDSIHNFKFCDQSLYLTYSSSINNITVKDHVFVNSNKIIKDAPILYNIQNSFTLIIDTESNDKPAFDVLLNFRNRYCDLTVKFYTETFPENLISISESSSSFTVQEKTDTIQKLFNSTEEINERYSWHYYCLSDKENKCSDFNISDIEYINSTSEIPSNIRAYLIIDTSIPQVITKSLYYLHIYSLAGSDLTVYPYYSSSYSSRINSVLLHTNSVEMGDLLFEGDGHFTLATNSNISILATTTKTNVRFSMKTKDPMKYKVSHVFPIKENLNIVLENKIHVPEYSLFTGPKCLSGLFEKDKFLNDEEFTNYNVTTDNLKETGFDFVTYYFKSGEHEIPATWKSPCKFVGIDHNETTFIFNDVHSYDGYSIDNFIELDYHDRVTIKPSKFLYLRSFDALITDKDYEKFTIQVENDFILDGYNALSNYDYEEMAHDQCRIVGKGKITFNDSQFKKDVESLCQIDETVELVENYTYFSFNICVGQSDLDKCKSEIKGIESLAESEWIWIRNLKTLDKIYRYKSIYITDHQYHDGSWRHFILTPNSKLTIPNSVNYYSNYYESLPNYINTQDNSVKIIVLFSEKHRKYFDIRDYNYPTKYDLQFYFYYEKAYFYSYYMKNITSKSIKLNGTCAIYIREPYKSMVGMFQRPDTIAFPINYEQDYSQICFSDEPEESTNLYDFILCQNTDEFNKYDTGVSTYVFKDITLMFRLRTVNCNTFHLYNNATITSELTNKSTLFIESSKYIIFDGETYYYIYSSNEQNKLIFDINDTINLDIKTNNYQYYLPSIEFRSSKESIEIIPSYSTKINRQFNISIQNNIKIFSPVPSYLSGLFGSEKINYSPRWSYLYLSDEGKSLYDQSSSINLISFNNIENDAELHDNIVLSIGANDTLSIPSNWSNVHNFFILQEGNELYVEEQSNLTYLRDGLLLKDKFQFIAGKLNVFVSENFTININLYGGPSIRYFFYDVKLNCSRNDHTDLYFGFLKYISNSYYNYYIKIYGNDSNNLTINHKNHNEKWDLNSIIDTYSFNSVNYYYLYKYIKYTNYDYDRENNFVVYSLTSLYSAIEEMPYLPVLLEKDVNFLYTFGNHLRLYSDNENIEIKLSEYPDSMTVFENKTVRFAYSDSSIIDIMNKSIINTDVFDSIDLDIRSETDSSITFELESDVFVFSDSNITSDINISVINNSYHLYSEEIEKFGNIFGEALELYVRICAHDDDSVSLCTFTKRDTFENIFEGPFNYNEIEIALSNNPVEINLPSVSKPVYVNVSRIPLAKSKLTLKTIYDLQINTNLIDINEHWTFDGDQRYLNLVLSNVSILSVVGEIKSKITLQLTNDLTYIDLRNFDKQSEQQITIKKNGEGTSRIIVFGPEKLYTNFVECLYRLNDVSISLNSTQKYLCVCNNNDDCNRCQKDIGGVITTVNKITSDPGQQTKIRVFSNSEVSSKVFTSEHDIFIDNSSTLILSDTKAVYQNVKEGIKIDNLYFMNGMNLVLKPDDIELNITMKKEEYGPYFTIEFEKFVRLNVVNYEEENIAASRLYANGEGELNIVEYPVDRIRAGPKVKIIKGVYLVCNSFCSYETMYGYKRLGHTHEFGPDFDQLSKIVVFLHTFSNNLDANLGYLKGQKILFGRDPLNPGELLEEQSKLRFISTEMICSSNESIELTGSLGGASLDNDDSDQFIVGFEKKLTIKHEGDISNDMNAITIQPMSEDVTVIIDDSVDINKQKFKVETEKDKTVTMNIVSNKNIDDGELLKNLFEIDEEKVSLVILDEQPTRKQKKSLPVGAIVGIVIGVVVVVSAIVVAIVLVMKKNKANKKEICSNDQQSIDDDEDDSSDIHCRRI